MRISPLLIFHISAGLFALLSGTVAMIFRKGSRGHVVAGRVFVISMLSLAAAGAILAVMKSQTGNVVGGIVTLYMVTTAWTTSRRRDGETGTLDSAALLVALAIGVWLLIYGFEAANSSTASKGGYPAIFYFIWASVVLLSGAGDLRMLLRRGVFGVQRITRHLWRMCFALFIASGSFFLGQQQVFPASWRGAPFWFVPALLPLLLMIFWLVRVRLKNAYNRTAPYRISEPGAEFAKQSSAS
jgi:uncharacterized membrane protein